MKRKTFKIHLKSEVAVGSPGTVNGGRDHLDYLQGGLFLGAVAARLYEQLGDDAWTVFHSGKMRFCDALPLSPSGQIAFPTPQSLAQKKHQQTEQAHLFQASELVNLAYQERVAGLDKVAAPYLSGAGEKVRPLTQYRLKTAIDPRTGGSMDRRLYGYHSLLPNQTYYFRLEADDDVADSLFQKVVAALQKPMRLGRSTSAEYGRVEVEPFEAQLPQPAPTSDGTLTLLLCSHLAVEDDGGAALALPESHQLGLPDGKLIRKRCFVRHAWHSMYNATYRAFESDLPIITRGSVLCYAMSPEDLAQVTRNPLLYAGLQQQRGFGCMLVNPPFLAESGAQFQAIDSKKETHQDVKCDHPLAQWLTERLENRKAEADIRSLAETWYQELRGLYESARVRGAFTADMVVGPTPSQWGRVSEVVAVALAKGMSMKQLQMLLFGNGNDKQDKAANKPICNANDPDWSKAIVHEALEKCLQQPPTFATWLKAKLAGEPAVSNPNQAITDDNRVRVLAHFARFAADRAKQQRNQQEENDA